MRGSGTYERSGRLTEAPKPIRDVGRNLTLVPRARESGSELSARPRGVVDVLNDLGRSADKQIL